MRTIRIGATLGAAVGAGIAVLTISIVMLRPFPITVNGLIERATFRLCPLFALGFSSYVKNWGELLFITIAGNAVLYGALFALVALVVVFLRKLMAGVSPQQ